MKVTGPGQPPGAGIPDADAFNKPAGEERGAVSEGRETSSGAFAERLEEVRPGESGDARVSRAGESGARDDAGRIRDVPVGDVAADLRAGRLTPEAAIDKVLQRVMARQLGPTAPPALRERVRTALQEAIHSDPLLAEKLTRLR